MLREFGVKGVKVQEVFGLDDEMLAMLPCVVQSSLMNESNSALQATSAWPHLFVPLQVR